jgi:hypothetical protein
MRKADKKSVHVMHDRRGGLSFFKIPKFRSIQQRGAIGIMTALLLPVLLGFLALSIELGRIYNRKVEMQSVADAIAISAAKKLNGTSAGLDDAIEAARFVVESGDATTTRPRYEYKRLMNFSETAIQFAKSLDGGGWMSAQAAKLSPAGVAYVKVDTNGLNSNYGKVGLILIRILGNFAPVYISHTTVAGRPYIKLMPFAICAMSRNPAEPFKERTTSGLVELTEYGFRRGISYNIMKLSPNTAAGVSYTVDPVSLPPKSGSFSTDIIASSVCTGKVGLPKVVGETLNLQKNFPFAQFAAHLNSRFDLPSGPCNSTAAPPDSNVKQFTYASNNWMTSPGRQVAKESISSSRIETVADLVPPAAQTSGNYGPLWTFAQAVPWSSYTAGGIEPPQGYLPFDATSGTWNSLYATNPGLSSYPKDSTGAYRSPYFIQVSGPPTNYPGVQFRRVLNVPLLECPAPDSPGKVVAIGRFFMTVPADTNGIYAEFAGVTLHEDLSNTVELMQ